MTDAELRHRRRRLREELLARRAGLDAAAREAAGTEVRRHLAALLPVLPAGPVAFYWPIREEIDLRPLARRLVASGRTLALPVIVEKKAPMVFRRWSPEVPMTTGVWDIPIPQPDERVTPRIVLLPVVGVDREGYRLGYGGGYYDRTLPTIRPRPLVVGIGYAHARIAGIDPRPHDQRLDMLVTEAGVERFGESGEETQCASPPCFAREIDPAFRDIG